MTSAKNTELAPWEDETEIAGLAAIAPTAELVQQAYDAIIEKTLPPEIGDPKITARMILERLKNSSLDESMTPAGSLPAWSKEYLDRAVTVFGFHMNKSTFEDEDGRKGVYAVVELAAADGELVTVQCGGQNVLVQLVKAWEEGRYPFRCCLVAQETGSPGRSTLYLRAVSEAPAA